MKLQNLQLETERLLLIPNRQKYAEVIFNELSEEIVKYMTPKSPRKISEIQEWIYSATEKRKLGKSLPMVILDKENKEFLGAVSISSIDERVPKFGIRIKKGAFGKKIGREAVAGLEDWAQKNLNFEYILYPVDKDNIPSRKIAESLGGIVETDEQGNEKVTIVSTQDENRKLNEVIYRIYKQK